MVGGHELSQNDVQATYCATLVDEWTRRGVVHAVIAPGSRSTPMALAIADRTELHVHVVHDERAAGFVALGLGLTGRPALLLCTSGTAAANFLPAVVEAGLSNVPMIVLTADRPDELRGVGAPQTIDQIELYGDHVRWFAHPGVPDNSARARWRPLAVDAWAKSFDGPVHLNLAFREPLIGAAHELPEPVGLARRSVSGGPVERLDTVPTGVDRERGIILAGGCSGVDAHRVADLRRITNWPIIADPTSRMRHLDGAVTSADAMLRVPDFAAEHRPEVVVRIGRPAASKVLARWIAESGAPVVQVGGPGVIDPDHNVVAVCSIESLLASAPLGATATTWMARWEAADAAADEAISSTLRALGELTEPAVARCLADHIPADAALTVSSSMPVRDLEWFGGTRARAHANRGANGIDGVSSTGLGRALGGEVSFVLIGDLAFVHDINALVGLAGRGADLRVVVIDNDGGGIFSFLPQASRLPTDRFEQLFGTPLGVDVLGLASAHRIATATATTVGELREQIDRPGPWVCRVPGDRNHNVEVHDLLHAAVATALG